MNTAAGSLETRLDTLIAAIKARATEHGVPDGATIYNAVNETDITSATAQTIKAAPGAGLRIFISEVVVHQPTSAETPVITLQDEDDNALDAIQSAAESTVRVTYDPPIALPVNKALEGVADGSTGDTKVYARGWVG